MTTPDIAEARRTIVDLKAWVQAYCNTDTTDTINPIWALAGALADDLANTREELAELRRQHDQRGGMLELTRMARDEAADELEQQDRALRSSVPERWKSCTSPVGAVQSYIAEMEQELERLRAQVAPLREFVERVSKQKPEKPDYWSGCGQCEHNISDAEDLLAAYRAAQQAPDNNSPGKTGCFPAAEKTNQALTVGERVERLKFELRQAMIDYGAAERAQDPERIRETTTRGVALIDSLAPLAEPGAQAEPVAWQPIETAPVSTLVLMAWRPVDHAARPHHIEIVIGSRCYDFNTYEPDGRVYSGGRYYDEATHVTHWMPLPATPGRSNPPAQGAAPGEPQWKPSSEP